MKRSASSRPAILGAFIGIVALVGIEACASSQPARPVPDPDPTLVSLTRWLKLDSPQQEKTRQLLEELRVRHAQILEKWNNGAKVRTQDLQQSSAIFERSFVAILTPEQRQLFASVKLKLQMKGRSLRAAS